MGSGGPVLAAVKAPRVARPLRATALTPVPRGTGEAIIAGPPPVRPDDQADAIPLAIENSMGSSLGVSPTREDRWDRGASVPGFWAWTGIEWNGWSEKLRRRTHASGCGLSTAGCAAMSARGVAAAPGRSAMPRNGPGTTCRGPRTRSRWSIGSAGYDVGPAGFAPSRWGSPMVTRASRAGCAS